MPEIPKPPTGLRARGKRLWRELHEFAEFGDCPETRLIAEEACYLTDEITRQRTLIRKAGTDTRVKGSQGQPVSMPEIADLQRNQGILLSLLKSLRLPDEDGGDGKLSRSQVGKIAAEARWRS
ncbi:hypothetical protein [[Mycobacterium] nativiensis]|uniref:Terminase n=1 Tax=[Mycobacterium] nativiensis TaxID=2855503 RepID=A0ABU5XSY4_9MYCO|nr:hypothetical protein [Mycolicibacter sp. MYC340]MEB3031082.1 hypothetical protein [Mycolicibacter sp. MYC340]